MNDWFIYRGNGSPHDDIETRLPDPPPWRRFDGRPMTLRPHGDSQSDATRQQQLAELVKATTYLPSKKEIELVNAALYLRRPLLITGMPGTGKSTLAYNVAYELKLGRVLDWPITSRSTREEGLYQYDALARLHDASIRDKASQADEEDIGRYIRLGPLGTALLPQKLPRVLLIDELDKSDIDLPNDLLAIFEDGRYEIPELSRVADRVGAADVLTFHGDDKATIRDGLVQCGAFPLVVITSNGERDFPPAFLRRCLRLHIEPPDEERLTAIVRSHLGHDREEESAAIIKAFLSRRSRGGLATDQLLNAVYLMYNRAWSDGRDELIDKIMHHIDQDADFR